MRYWDERGTKRVIPGGVYVVPMYRHRSGITGSYQDSPMITPTSERALASFSLFPLVLAFLRIGYSTLN